MLVQQTTKKLESFFKIPAFIILTKLYLPFKLNTIILQMMMAPPRNVPRLGISRRIRNPKMVESSGVTNMKLVTSLVRWQKTLLCPKGSKLLHWEKHPNIQAAEYGICLKQPIAGIPVQTKSPKARHRKSCCK